MKSVKLIKTENPIDMLPAEGVLSSGHRCQYVAEAAYYKAEKRGFEPGYEEQDWLEAEHEIEELLIERGIL
jgi:hypothetical protein